MAVYDDEQQKTGVSDDELRKITGVSPDEEDAMDREAYSGAARDIESRGSVSSEKLAAEEAEGATALSGAAEKSEASNLKGDAKDSGDGWFKGDKDKPKRRFRLTKKQGVGGGVAAVVIAGGFWGFSILQGPLQLIHIAQSLQNFHFAINNEASGSRLSRVYEYIRTGNDPSKRNLGYLGEKLSQKYIADMSRDGINMDFEQPNGRLSRRVQSLTIDMDHPRSQDAIKRLKAEGLSISDEGVIDLRGDGASAKARRRALFAAVDLQDKGKISAAVTKRLLALRAGVDFHPLRNIRRDARESFADYIRKRREERSDRNKDGVDVRRGTGDLEGEQQPDPNDPEGGNIENPEAGGVADEGNDVVREAVDADTPDLRRSLASRVGGGAAAIIGMMCMGRAIGNSIPAYQQANILLPMMRMSMEFVAIGSQIMTGQDVNLDEMGAVVSTLYDEENESAFMGARGMQAVTGQELTGPDTKVKPSAVGEKPQIFDILDGVPFLGQACTIQDSAGNFVRSIPVIGSGVKGIENLFMGGLDAFLESATGSTLGEFMERLIGLLAGDLVDTFAEGAELGNIAAIGGRLAANDAAIATGGRALSTSEFAALRQQYMATEDEEFLQRSFFARTLDLKDDRSLAARMILSSPVKNNPEASFTNIARITLNLPATLASNLNPFASQVQAQEASEYDFGVDPYGFSAAELDDENFADPYVIGDYVEEIIDPATGKRRLHEMNERYGDCFANRIDPNTFRLIVGETPSYEKVTSSECNDGSQDLKYYRYYLMDTTTVKSMACYEGVDESACEEIGFGGPGSGSTAPPPSGSADPGQDTSGMQCPTGTEDGGVHQDYGPGGAPTVKIRICGIPDGIPADRGVNASIAAQTLAMFEAMRAAGLHPRGNAFRSYETQQQLREQNCPDPINSRASSCSPPTAKAGSSMHEVGLAIDFSNMCYPNATCRPGTNGAYDWLTANAATYGFSKLSTEAWHWSVTGN